MKISIITATYNSVNTLAETMRSVIQQTYPDWELIIEDGQSTDGTLELAHGFQKEMGDRLVIFSEQDNGLYDAMNKGISRATGDIIGVLNSDDLLKDSTVLEDIAKAFEEHPEADAVYGNLNFVQQHNIHSLVRIWRGSQYEPGLFQKGWSPAHPTFYCKKAIYDKYGAFNTSLSISADFELMLRLIEVHRIKTLYVDRFFVRMRMGGESTGTLRNIIRGNLNILKAFRINNIKVNPVSYVICRLAPKAWGIIKLRIYMILYRKKQRKNKPLS